MSLQLPCVAAAVCFAAPAIAQPADVADTREARVAFLKANTVEVRTIDPTDEDFTDLEPLISLIGDARVVLLGEQTHGDGACFLAKSRLVRFLHKRMGFDVLAFESGMFDMAWVEEGMRNSAPLSEVQRRGLFGIWAASEQCRELLEYIRLTNKQERPLELAGFDSQYSSGDAREQFPAAVRAFFEKAGAATPEQLQPVADLEQWIEECGPVPKTRPTEQIKGVERVIALLDEQRNLLARVHAQRDIDFMRRCLRNQIEFARQCALGRAGVVEGGRIRDTAMGENLVWLADDYFRGRKVIVWAASMHNMYNAPQAWLNGDPDFYEHAITMGHVARKKLGGAMYSIMFLADHGRIGRPWTGSGPITEAPKHTFDSMLHDAGFTFGFLDLKSAAAKEGGAWLKERLPARPLGYAICEAVWPDQCDAFFFTDEMTPSTAWKQPERRSAPPPPPRE
jgi:erythromycin esterase